MRKYLAVIKDSFREALASRVLWVLLLLITVMLLAVSPIGYREVLTFRLGDNDVRTWPDWMHMVRTEGVNEEPSPIRKIWTSLDEKLQKRLIEVKIPGRDQDAGNPMEFISAMTGFQRGVNRLLRDREFYDEESFRNALEDEEAISDELKELCEIGLDELTDTQVARFNRLLIETAFPDVIRTSNSASIQWTYGWMELLSPQPLRGTTLRERLAGNTMLAVTWLLGVFGIFAAVLVTAYIIPQLFQSGSLHLLISKPIARWALFLAKYVGGCCFILIIASYLIGGFWLILGVRFGVWESKLLYAVPVYLFVFAVYYSVSALTGLVWRNAVACIIVTMIFFVTCFCVEWAKFMYDQAVISKDRFVDFVEADQDLIAVTELGVCHVWDESSVEWNRIFVSDDQRQALWVFRWMPVVPSEVRPVGPLFDPVEQKLISAPPSFTGGQRHIYVGNSQDDWSAVKGIATPRAAFAMFREPDGSLLFVSALGLNRLVGNALAPDVPVKLFGMKLPFNVGNAYQMVSPNSFVPLAFPSAAAMDLDNGNLVLYSRGKLLVLSPGEKGVFEHVVEREIEEDSQKPVTLAVAGSLVLVGRHDGSIQVLSSDTLETRTELKADGEAARFIRASDDARWFAISLHNGELWLYDVGQSSFEKAAVRGQGDISFASFTHSGELLVADGTMHVSRYKLDSLERVKSYSPKLGTLDRLYRYGLMPLYTVFPKPGELDKTFRYLLSGEESQQLDQGDLGTAQRKIDPWTPLWSTALFTLFILFISCVYIEYQEF